jgi:glycerophosphoryl diester phosphodiesterase
MAPRVSAHKGGAERARAATYEAYEDAVTSGAQYAEFDIRRTRDGALVVYHDSAVAAGPAPAAGAGAGPGRVSLASLDYAGLCAAAGYRVPLVRDVMALLARHGLAGHLDLKETGYEAEVAALAIAVMGPGHFVVTTLEDTSVAAVKSAFPQVIAALSLGRDLGGVPWPQWPRIRASELAPLPRIRRCGADWVAVNYKLARLGVTRACHRDGIGVMVWTVDGDGALEEFLGDDRVDVVITNRPRYAAGRRAALRRPG